MIALDTNVLIYAHRRDSPFHDVVRPLVAELAAGREAVAVPWPCLHEFLAVVTNARVFSDPTPVPAALDQIDVWLSAPSVGPIAEAVDHRRTLGRLVTQGRATGARIHDARIAAICLDHGVRELWSADRDFSRFPELRVWNPLTGRPDGEIGVSPG